MALTRAQRFDWMTSRGSIHTSNMPSFLDRFGNSRPKPSPLLDEQVAAGLRGDFKRGREIADQLKREMPECNRAAFNRAWYELMDGKLLEGLSLLDQGRWERVFGDQPLPSGKPIWRDEDLNGRYLLMCSEGGLGDEIINARFATDFARRGAKVILTCDPNLAPVFSRIEGVSAVIGHRRAVEVYHDFWVPAMSAARVLRYEYENLTGAPYISARPEYVAKWNSLLRSLHGRVPDIGLRFYGNPKFEHEQHRRFPKEDLVRALGGRDWVNLQLEETRLPIESWEDTLGILANLKLVITSCTSVAHASAALGKPTWVIAPVLPYYIWALPGDRSPWYRSVRLFRQTTFGDWSAPLNDVAHALTVSD